MPINKHMFRNIVNIIQEQERSQEAISNAYDIIERYVSTGEWPSPTYFDRDLIKLMEYWPRPDHSMTLYRVLRLNQIQLAQYYAGELVLEPRRFSSWTKDADVAKVLAQTKGDVCLIITDTFSPEHIVVDVDDFYVENEFNNFEFTEYHRYVAREKEVIVYNSSSIKITPENSAIFVPDANQKPQQGDYVFKDYDDPIGRIEELTNTQKYATRGIFYVTDDNGDDYFVRNVGPSEWEVVEEINEMIQEDGEDGTITLWHGGRNLESGYMDFPSHKKGSWEHGPGLYATVDRSVAARYAKGGNAMYKIDVKLERNIDSVSLDQDTVKEFIKKFITTSKRKEFWNYVVRGMERKNTDTINAETLINLSLNLEAMSHTKTGEFRKWLAEQGVGYIHIPNYGGWGIDKGNVYVIVDPKLIRKVYRA